MRWQDVARAIAEPELVHEMLEGAVVPAGQSPGQDARRVSSRDASRAWRSSTKRRFWRVCAYIDLNPVAAGIVPVPEASPIRRSILASSTCRRKVEPPTWRRPKVAAWRARVRRRAWRSRSGSARSRIVGGWILHVKECWKDSRSEAICSWSTTRAGSSARARPRFRASSRRSLIGWAAAPRAGGRGWRSSRQGRLFGRFFAASRDRLQRVRQPVGRAPPGQSGRMPGAITRTSGRGWHDRGSACAVFPLSRR